MRARAAGMNWWRISKYDPALREADGRYLHEDWTSMGDIGKTFSGRVLTGAEYSAVEAEMIAVALAYHGDAGRPVLQIRSLELHEEQEPPVQRLLDRGSVGIDGLVDIVRSCLRELFWCRLESADGRCAVHFGYDYYMYLGGLPSPDGMFEAVAETRLFREGVSPPHSHGDAEAEAGRT